MSKKRFFTLAAALLFASVCSADFSLAENGKSSCNIVVKKGAALPVSFGAKELSLFTEKVSSAKIPVAENAVKNAKNIFVGTIEDKDLVKRSGVDAKKLKEDGFALIVKNNVIYIVGQNPRGALYGCYEIVKNMRACVSSSPERTALTIPQKRVSPFRNRIPLKTLTCVTAFFSAAMRSMAQPFLQETIFSAVREHGISLIKKADAPELPICLNLWQ